MMCGSDVGGPSEAEWAGSEDEKQFRQELVASVGAMGCFGWGLRTPEEMDEKPIGGKNDGKE